MPSSRPGSGSPVQLIGTLGALAALGIYAGTGSLLFLGLAYVGFLLNLFNLLPILPLDGGRAVGAMSPAFWVLGATTVGVLLFVTPFNPIFLVILLFVAYSGGRELWHRWRRRNTPERQAYNDIELRHRVMVGLVYFGLIAMLALLMAITYVPDPGGATPVLS